MKLAKLNVKAVCMNILNNLMSNNDVTLFNRAYMHYLIIKVDYFYYNATLDTL